MNRLSGNEAGFTLLEFMIAFALLAVVLASTYIAQSSSLFASSRTKNTSIAVRLAHNKLNELELKYEGQKFDSLTQTEEGDFDEPYKQFHWKQEIKEVDFTALSDLLVAAAQEKSGGTFKEEEGTVVKLFQDYLKKSVRKLVFTVEWPEGGGKNSLSFTTFLVNYDAEFAAGF